uniref:Uncharacterized protein n=1 Tax=Anguilla anguilla TaxID=7936 RepID=A0A0E9PFQ6_ANGAN
MESCSENKTDRASPSERGIHINQPKHPNLTAASKGGPYINP